MYCVVILMVVTFFLSCFEVLPVMQVDPFFYETVDNLISCLDDEGVGIVLYIMETSLLRFSSIYDKNQCLLLSEMSSCVSCSFLTILFFCCPNPSSTQCNQVLLRCLEFTLQRSQILETRMNVLNLEVHHLPKSLQILSRHCIIPITYLFSHRCMNKQTNAK